MRVTYQDKPGLRRERNTAMLAFVWLLGLFCGVVLYFKADVEFYTLMRGVVYSSVSIVGLLCVAILPFLLSAFAVLISEPCLLFPICFGKAILFSFISLGIADCYGSAGWLIRWLLMFTDLTSIPLLYGFWQRYISGVRKFDVLECGVFFAMCILIGSIDCSLISPFWVKLINL